MPSKQKLTAPNITPSVVKGVFDNLEGVFGNGAVLLIGGCAVNAYCPEKQRKVHDIDFLIAYDARQLNSKLRKTLRGSGIVPLNDYKTGFMITTARMGRYAYPIDLFFNEFDDYHHQQLHNLSFETALKARLANGDVINLVHPALLVIIDFDYDMYKLGDIRNIITSVYGSPLRFFEQEGGIIKKVFRLFGDEENEAITGNPFRASLDWQQQSLIKWFEFLKEKNIVDASAILYENGCPAPTPNLDMLALAFFTKSLMEKLSQRNGASNTPSQGSYLRKEPQIQA